MKIGQAVALLIAPYLNPAHRIIHKGTVVALRQDFGGEHAKILWQDETEARDLWINTIFLVDPVTLRPQNTGHAQTEDRQQPQA